MSLALSRIAMHALAIGSLAVSSSFGPPRISVSPVTDPSKAPAGAVLLVESMHHTELADLNVTARAEGLVNGKRVTLPLRLTHQSIGHYALTKQWQDGTPWVLVLSAEQGPNGAHGVAEALVKVAASGAFASIDYPAVGWVNKSDTPKRTSAAEIDATLTGMVARR
jgi:hypothetical protein